MGLSKRWSPIFTVNRCGAVHQSEGARKPVGVVAALEPAVELLVEAGDAVTVIAEMVRTVAHSVAAIHVVSPERTMVSGEARDELRRIPSQGTALVVHRSQAPDTHTQLNFVSPIWLIFSSQASCDVRLEHALLDSAWQPASSHGDYDEAHSDGSICGGRIA